MKKMEKAIVTGANGFIGSNLVRVMSQAGVKIFAIIKDIDEEVDSIKNLPNVEIIYCCLEEIDKLPNLITDHQIDVCIHLAWAGSFGEARSDYELQLLNVKYASKIIDVIASMGIKRFVGAGTLAEMDVLNYHPIDGSVPNAVSIYGIAKIATHFMTKAICAKYGMEHIWCFLSNTYGIGNTTDNFVNMASRKMIKREHAAFTEGNQTYDFVYVTDTVRAIYAAAKYGKVNTAYYLGSGQPRKLKEYIEIIRDTIDPSIELFFGEIPFRGIALSADAYDASKIMEHTDFKPVVTFEEGIKKTVEWLIEQQ